MLPKVEAGVDVDFVDLTIRGAYLYPYGKWYSQICHKGSLIGLGSYDSQQEAAVAFDKACLYLRGRDTELNFKLSDYLDAQGEIIEDLTIRDRIESRSRMRGLERWVA